MGSRVEIRTLVAVPNMEGRVIRSMNTSIKCMENHSRDEGSRAECWHSFPPQWDAITKARNGLIIEPRKIDQLGEAVTALLELETFSWIAAGSVREAVSQLADLPPSLLRDIEDLATRFAELTGSDYARIRLEQITTNSCRRMHTDYTDLRLITTYAGPGTQIAFDNDPRSEILLDVPVGYIGIFKGRRYGANHKPCYHRSPPAADWGVKRLVLVIDTQVFASESECE